MGTGGIGTLIVTVRILTTVSDCGLPAQVLPSFHEEIWISDAPRAANRAPISESSGHSSANSSSATEQTDSRGMWTSWRLGRGPKAAKKGLQQQLGELAASAGLYGLAGTSSNSCSSAPSATTVGRPAAHCRPTQGPRNANPALSSQRTPSRQAAWHPRCSCLDGSPCDLPARCAFRRLGGEAAASLRAGWAAPLQAAAPTGAKVHSPVGGHILQAPRRLSLRLRREAGGPWS
mmetsp:Transcript_45482/g.140530  ORF Transcript_45482/g.140530 Transcript_45482/m.140530 type:complete len:233 (-) Transcript_45482:2-700(-)